MKIGIICAMQEELDSAINKLNLQCKTQEERGFSTYITTYQTHELIFILSGIGKVNAAIHTQYIIDKFDVDCVINVGVAGSLSQELSFGDVVIATDLVQHDMDVVAFGMSLGQIPRMDVFSFVSDENLLNAAKLLHVDGYKMQFGRIISGDQFIDNKDKVVFLAREFNAMACEMEGAAVAHACYVNRVPFIVIRALSDMAGQDGDAIHSFTELKDMSADRASLVIQQLLPHL